MPDPRFVVDEASFDFNGFDANEITDSLQALTNELACLRSDGETASVLSGWGAIICIGKTDVASLLTDHLLVARDLGARLLSLLDKCTAWDDSCAEIVEPAVVVEGTPLESFGIAWVVQQQQAGRATAVVTLKHRPYRGAFSVTNQSANSNVHFVVEPQDHPSFFRSVYSVENVPEREFFSVASLAFPNLDFAEGLSFGRFDGTYANLKIVVVKHLSALHDLFPAAARLENQQSRAISARIGVDVSIESSNTRKSPAKMKERDAVFNGASFKCEWHSKIEPTRNRIHFCPIGGTSDRIVIGIFVDHLET